MGFEEIKYYNNVEKSPLVFPKTLNKQSLITKQVAIL